MGVQIRTVPGMNSLAMVHMTVLDYFSGRRSVLSSALGTVFHLLSAGITLFCSIKVGRMWLVVPGLLLYHSQCRTTEVPHSQPHPQHNAQESPGGRDGPKLWHVPTLEVAKIETLMSNSTKTTGNQKKRALQIHLC